MPSTWDIWFKKLVQIRPQDFATWLLAEARCEKPVFVSSTLNSRNIYSDMLLRTQYHNEEILLHIEFQSDADNEMGRRLLEYNVLAGNQYTVPVYSFVIYLLKKGEVVRSPYTSRLPGGKLVYEFHYETIELWRASAKALFSEQPTDAAGLSSVR